ncbi:MAG: hypothetical protein Q8R39_01825 [bacterium]|nr:hypothetical protein [bacterium]MDZ4284744.1 hypothetical protein [Patescibacteria group bacterium]
MSPSRKQISSALGITALLVGGALVLGESARRPASEDDNHHTVPTALAAQFEALSEGGNSSCSGEFKNSIADMPDGERIRGSCCTPMEVHRYSEQIEGLKKFKAVGGQNIAEIPDDPYDIDAQLAERLIAYYDLELTAEEQQAYDYAMLYSNEKGPCCCRCWRWFVYGGLGKYLIQNHGFTGEQLTELWNLSDGCGGDEDHQH